MYASVVFCCLSLNLTGNLMPRTLSKLSALTVTKLKKKGWHADGGGLYLQVGDAGNKSWIFRFTLQGKPYIMGLGPIHTVSLAEARTKALNCRKLLLDGVNPLVARKRDMAAIKVSEAKGTTFETCAKAYIDAHAAGWKHSHHAKQWEQSLKKYSYPIIGSLPVQAIDTELIMKVLEPIWREKTETAKRMRGRIESILDWAKTREYRSGENPARWRGHLENLLVSPSKIIKVKHFSALPYSEVHEFLQELKKQEGLGAQALALTILTASRSNEVLYADWNEIDIDKKVWVIPAERMKGKKEHRVPLTEPALTILKDLKHKRDKERVKEQSPHIFPNQSNDGYFSNAVMMALLKRMERTDITVHGFRSTFRDWAAEQTEFPREVIEAALAHSIPSKVEAAYLRSDYLDKRRLLMEAWADFCQTKPKSKSGKQEE